MIQGFKDNFTEQVYHNRKAVSGEFISHRELVKAFIWLDLLNLASHPQDMNLAPENPLRHLQDDQWEVHMPKGWLISFTWTLPGPTNVCLQRNQET